MDSQKTELRPGKPMARWQLFEPKVDQTNMKSVGVHDPEGKFHPFTKGEEFIAISLENSNDRQPYIKTTNGTLIPFDVWTEQPKNEG